MADEKRLIDANALLDALGYDPMKFWAITPESTFGIVLNAPTVDAVEVVHGRWFYDGGEMTYFCSKCGKGAIRHKTTFLDTSTLVEDCLSHYCPNCGAKMDGDGNA